MVGKGRGKRLTDSERMEIIARLENTTVPLSRAKCAREYGVTPAAISKLMKVSQTVKKRYSDAGADAGGLRDKRQRGGFSKNVPFEDELYQWICSVRARKIPLLVAHVQQKAKLLAARHHMNEAFKASNGWYYRFCARYGLAPASLHAGAPVALQSVGAGVGLATTNASQPRAGEAVKAADAETAHKLMGLREQVAQIGPEFVYTVSEARLFYQLLPSHIRPPSMSSAATATATGGMPGMNTAVPGASGPSALDAVRDGNAVGNTARVLVLVCSNGTGTHKMPLLVVGKEPAPASLATLHPELLRDVPVNNNSDSNDTSIGGASSRGRGSGSGSSVGIGMGTSYYNQREVWCDDHTFQHWCDRIFLPAIRQRTTRPVLLVAENPGGRLAPFHQENVTTIFLPLRTGNGSGEVTFQSGLPSQQPGQPTTGGPNNSSASSAVQFQPLHGGVIRDLKRRYKVALFQERLSFLEKPDDERFRLIQRAMKKPPGSVGVAFGRAPHLLDAMSLLDEVWATMPPSLVHGCWVKANLGGSASSTLPASTPMPPPSASELSDEMVVLELCSMMRHVTIVEDMNIGGAFVYRTADGRPAPMDPTVALREKHKTISFALHALATAEEALDNADVVEFFGKEAAGQTLEGVSRALRRLRRVQRGKHSALVAAAANATASGASNGSAGGAASTHEFFYGAGALDRMT
ncbi:hypothetical protein BBJ28_00012527 [Nothophytophthora sp. Chile5]|nr:hypothetical protein BBJ28_00012527 [Nothophytophthora sp. Chile5]